MALFWYTFAVPARRPLSLRCFYGAYYQNAQFNETNEKDI